MITKEQVFILSQKTTFSEHINRCLKEDCLDSDLSEKFNDKSSAVIINLFEKNDFIISQIDQVLQSSAEKVILIENALDLYLNSKNRLPFSVYSKIIPKNEKCERCLEIENKIIESGKQHVILRVSEIYGSSIQNSLIENLLFYNCDKEVENSSHDFIFDGDVISAIEISLKKGVTGIFDIANGNSIDLRNLVNIIKEIRREEIKIEWKRKRLDIVFNCDNFKFYKWEPLVNIETGLKTLFSLKRRSYGELHSSRNN